MIYDKKKGSLLNYIQLPLHVVTPNGTYLGVGYDFDVPKYILSHVRLVTYPVTDLVFSNMSKDAIINNSEPLLKITDGKIGYDYKISDTEIKYGYITVASKRIDITQGTITAESAKLILERQLRGIGNVLEQFVKQPLSQPQFDALLHYFYYIGVDKVETSSVIELINIARWYDITDEMQTNIKRNSGKVDEYLAAVKIRSAKMWGFVPGF